MASLRLTQAFSKLSVSCAVNGQSSKFGTAKTSYTSLSASSSYSNSAIVMGTRPAAALPSAASMLVVCADKKPRKKIDTAIKRAKQAESRRLYHKSRRSEMTTRMKKVFLALKGLKTGGASSEEDFKPLDGLLAEAYSVIDKSVKIGTIHRNKGARRKSRLARARRDLLIKFGLYAPPPAEENVTSAVSV